MKKLTSTIALIMALILLLTACSGTGGGATDAPPANGSSTNTPNTAPAETDGGGQGELTPINVALEFCLSGGGGWVGELMRAAIFVALDDYEEDFAELGYAINPIFNDHQASNEVAALNFTKDVDLYNCEVVISSFTGPVITQAPMAAESKVLILNPGAQGDLLVGLSDYMFTTVPSLSMVCGVMADYLYNEAGYRKLGALGDASSTAKSQHDAFLAAWEALGGEVVADIETEANASDYMSVCSQVVSAGAEFVLVANADDSLTTRQMMQFTQVGAGEDMAFVSLSTGNPAFGAEFNNPTYVSSQKVFATEEVISKYENEYMVEGYPFENCAIYICNYYNSIGILYQLVRYCNDKGVEITGENLKTAFENLETIEIMGGEMSLIEGNTVECPIEVFHAVAGEVTVAATYYEN